ncbi:MAG: conjugative transposon protein TraN [Bacteroidota bacterium]
MKWTLIISMFCFCAVVNAQPVVAPRNLQVTVNKTSNLIFPSTIVSVDRGSEHIIVQKSTTNVLRVKADTVFADTTNLSVITTDGRLYSFLVNYSVSPQILNIDLGAGEMINKDTALVAMAGKVIQYKSNLYGLQYSAGRIKLSIIGMYTNSEVLICKVRIENKSSLSFEIGRLRFFVSGSSSGKRRSVQETEVMPLLLQAERTLIRAKQSVQLVAVLPKTALGTKQILQIDLVEKGGERHLSLRLPNKYILNATIIK